MIIPMVMPQVSITSAEVKLVSWLKKPGDPVRRGEPMVEVETEKATIEVESYVDGYFRVANYQNGATVPVDAVIAVLSTTADEQIDDRPIETTEARAYTITQATVVDSDKVKRGRIDISPVARKLADDNHIDLAILQGSGPNGRIIRSDVEAFLQAKKEKSGPEGKANLTATLVPNFSVRRAIAQRTVLSKTSIPHYYVSIDIDMQAVLDWVADLKRIAVSRRKVSPTLTDIFIWVCGRILPQYPSLHGSWSDAGPMFNPEINIGMVVGLEEGLIVPIVHEVNRISLATLAETTHKLKQKARQGGLSDRELTGGTFTISNLGMFGISSFIAVINPPESAILALGATSKRVVVNENDEIVIRPIMTATLSIDHRMVDGIVAAKFLNELKEKLDKPSLLLFDFC